MTKAGRITRSGGGMLQITFCGGSECEKCGACAGGRRESVLWVRGDGAVGDVAVVEIPDSQGIRASLLAYAMPVVFLIAGLLLGQRFFPGNDTAACLLAFLGLAFALVILFLTEKKRRNDPAWTPKLLEIIPENGENKDQPIAERK